MELEYDRGMDVFADEAAADIRKAFAGNPRQNGLLAALPESDWLRWLPGCVDATIEACAKHR